MIDPKLQSFSELISGDYQFVIPDYQRPFAWKTDEVGELIEDISSFTNRTSSLFLGTIILDVSELSAKKIEVVDGQQRLTSLFLLLIACRDHAKAIQAPNQAQATQLKISFTDEIQNRSIGMKLLASVSVRAAFEVMASSDWNETFPEGLSKIAVRRVKPVYEYFRKQLKSLSASQLGTLQTAIYGIQVLRINISGKDEAFAIFERTNARGMDLEVADLLKNFLHQKKLATIRDDWNSIVRNASSSMLRMLKAYYVAVHGPIQKAELYRGLKKHAESFKDTQGFVHELLEFSHFYAYTLKATTNPEHTKEYFLSTKLVGVARHQDRFSEAHSAIQALRSFKVTQAQSVIFACMMAMRRLGLSGDAATAKAFTRLLRGLENFHFVNTFICSHIGNEVESFYASAAESLRKTGSVPVAVEKLLQELKKKRAPISEFRESFAATEYSPKTTARLAYVFDRFNNHERKAAERKVIFYPDPEMFFNHFNVEHLYPQKSSLKVVPKLLNNIGNLTVMSVQLNSELGNKSAKQKFELMQGKLKPRIAEFPEIADLLQQFGTEDRMLSNEETFWGDTEIEQRARALADRAYTQIWQM